ncbi:MAG TPA: DNA-directed RNA polymerase subunit omega [Smithellaceae bacterium]|jgi:DNA-directed RNA polymerase subunit omega|nr:DNA-directed RNA polymerase subunit omega [Smithellaceae bacterium]HPL97179.1 DNA-directed RNA polymerase subunit omega [Smithellaceae bacterium]HQF83438.1 DNA-directed RNA polymerase subunit omega [Smithellaceae bacterium]HQG80068.1 DNA-directed RNA polymerase subunit omega [Smithellaceae bacterium]
MARITVEDSLRMAKTRFGLVSLASLRARQLLKGSKPILESKNREIVLALREIAAGKVNYAHPEYLQGSKEDFKPIPDSTEFIGDEEYLE